MLAGKGEAFRLMNALHDRDGVLADLREDLGVPRLEFVGREVGLIVLRARRGWDQQQGGRDQFDPHIGSSLVRLARAGSCCLSLTARL